MNTLTFEIMSETSGGDLKGCLIGILGRAGAIAGLALCTGGVGVLISILGYMSSGIYVGIECAEALQSAMEN